MSHDKRFAGILVAVSAMACSLGSAACVAVSAADDETLAEGEEIQESEDALAFQGGVNGGSCLESPYNCRLRGPGQTNSVMRTADSNDWPVEHGELLDGDGEHLWDSGYNKMSFNFGQKRRMHDRTYVFARSTGNGSTGWFPIDLVRDEQALRAKLGSARAEDTNGARMGCWAVADHHDTKIANLKVTKGTKSKNEKAGDYMALKRKNGARYANLAFNTPGKKLGSPAVDLFKAGTVFHRVDVPKFANAKSQKPSIDVPLYAKASDGRYTKRKGKLTFIYGYVEPKSGGAPRFGWMATAALDPLPSCP